MTDLFSRFNPNYFFAIPPESYGLWVWLSTFTVLLLATFAFYIYLRAKAAKQKPYKKYAKNFFWPNFTLAIIGLLLVFARYEKLALLSWRFWIFLVILFAIVFNVWHLIIKKSKLEDDLLKFHNDERKAKWMTKAKK